MPAKIPPFKLFFEIIFLESYARLGTSEKKVIDKAIKTLADNPRHPSLNIHKAKNVGGKYSTGGRDVFIAYASRKLRFTFEYGPEAGMIALRNCGHHDKTEKKM
jgi:mRNA-degrading endonuclease RelE of RelBE toxin-antitoxin system